MLPTGTIVAGYRIDGILGRGGMGVVYEATQLSLDRKVALKLIAPEMGVDHALQERFRREGLRQAGIDHPHIVTVHEAGETEHGLYLAMRLVRGCTLKQMVGSPALDVDRTLRILTQIADALDTAHEAGLIHRDVKPQNILVSSRDHAYLADFGLTKTPGDRSLTRSGGFVGTLDYVAPEQIRGEDTSARTDVYALAAVLYECLTGVVPYPKESDAAILWAHLALAPPRVSVARPDLPAALDAVIGRALAKKPEARFATAGELLASAQGSLSRGGRAAGSAPAPPDAGDRGAGSNVSTLHTAVPWLASAPSDAAPPVPAPSVPAPPVPAPTPPVPAPPVPTPRLPTPPLPAPSPTLQQPPTIAEPPYRGGPPKRSRRTPRAAIAMAVVVLAGALTAGGYLSGASNGEADRALRPLATGPLRLEVPKNWRAAVPVARVPGLVLAESAGAFAGGSSGRGPGLLAGLADGGGPTLLPTAFLKLLPGPPGTDDVVALGELKAYRYRDLHPRGLDRPLTLFVVPTQDRVATIACLGSPTATPPAECERAAATLQLAGLRALPLGARDDYAKALNAAIGTLNARRDRGRTELGSATTPSTRTRAADALSQAFARAASSLATIAAGPAERPATTALQNDVRGVATAYARLAAAARRQSAVDYNAAAASIGARESAIEGDLRALERLGYSVK